MWVMWRFVVCLVSGETGIVQVISSNASCSLEEMVDVKLPDQTLMWQYYVAADRVRAEKSLRKALDLGMQSIWVTVDAPVVSRARHFTPLKLIMLIFPRWAYPGRQT
jgi:isopentenyl diphosphate isomerase/L-lactate dehydrogenase-like FMN-dependent dehydrogenase